MHEVSASGEKTPGYLDLLFASLLVSVLWGGLAQLDPFGLKTAADLQSEAVFMRMVGGPWYESSARDSITVILVNDAYLEQVGEAWPMSYLQQDLLLTDILAYQPKAVFMDFLYRHPHGSPEEMAQLAATIRTSLPGSDGRPIPVYLPFLARDFEGMGTCGDNPDLRALPAASLIQANSVLDAMQPPEANRTYIGWSGCGNRYPMYLGGRQELPTPAFAMYRHHCRQQGRDSDACKAILAGDESAFAEPMVIRWGTGVSTLHAAAMQGGDIQCTRSDEINRFTYALSQLAEAMSQALSSNRERGQAEKCTYTDTLHATWLLGTSGELHEFLDDMIRDRYVLIGSRVDGVPDVILSPVNGQLPGVYIFAMALDNLMTEGRDYIRELDNLSAAGLEILTLFGINVLSLVLWRRRFFQLGPVPALIAYKLLLPLLLSFLVTVFMWQFNIAPMDWVTVAFLGFFSNPITLNDCCRIRVLEYISWALSTR